MTDTERTEFQWLGPLRVTPRAFRRRRRIVFAVATSLIGLTVAGASIADAPAPAVAATAFTFGEGSAEAQSLNIDVNDSGANINVYAGQATAGYQDNEANASASSVNIPLSGLLGSLQICSQPPPNIPIPTPLTVDTGSNGNTAPVSDSDVTGTGAAGMRSISASPSSHAQGNDQLSSFGLPGIVEVAGGQSEVGIAADDQSMTRSATATSDISTVSLLGGTIKLGGLHWQLQQSETGSDSRSDQRSSSSSFSMSSITVGKVTIPVTSPSEVATAAAAANLLLAPLGLSLHLPTQVSTSAGDALSPLEIAVGGNKDLWGPVVAELLGGVTLNQIERTLTGNLFDPVDCNELGGLLKSSGELNLYWNFLGAAAPLAIGILGQALGGSGEVDFNVGGVSTSLDDTYYPPVAFAPADGWNSGADGAPNSSGESGSVPSTSIPSAMPSPPRKGALLPMVTTASTTKCQSTSPAARPICWVGQAPLGAAIVGAGVLGLWIADEIYLRRRMRREVGQQEK